MKLLIIDKEGVGLGLALDAQSAGHSVKLCISPKAKSCRSGEGLVQKVVDWEPHMKWADLIFLTDNSYAMTSLEDYRKKGFPIFGCGEEAATWELDRKRGQEILAKAGIKTIGGKAFTSYDEAEVYVMKTPARYVSKPNGDLDKKLSYVSKSAADMVYMLRAWKRQGKVQSEFILQDFMPGVEMGVGGWFGADGWSEAFCENWEFKKLCNDDVGVATGEMGTVVRYVEKSLLAEKVLHPLTPFLHAIGYVGYCDVNCIIAKSGTPYPLEFTMRPGWPLFNIQRYLHKGDPIEWMADKLEGRDTLNVYDDVAVGVVMALPDFPYSQYTRREVEGIPIYGLTPKVSKQVSLASVMAGKAPALVNGKIVDKELPVSTGDYLCVVSGCGETVGDARESAYKAVRSLEIPNSIIYRTDIGCRLESQLPTLKEKGYAKGLRY